MSLTYLVSGANRGIGLGIVTALAGRPNTTVFAGARNPAAATDLNALAAKHPNNLHVLKLVSGDKPGNLAAVEEIRKKAGKLDVVIANAGIGDFFASTLEMKPEEMTRHFDVNVNGTLVLFQATYPLLKESPVRKFVPIGSLVGSVSIGSQFPARMLAYGASKAALHYLTRKIYQEHPELTVFAVNPGDGVATDMATRTFEAEPGMKGMTPIKVEDSVNGMLNIIDGATRETLGGEFVNFDGTKFTW
ncbi:hypothetical protein EV714DRAFT_250751 [Schizophyllum commune]